MNKNYNFFLITLFLSFTSQIFATQYHTISGGGNPAWSHTQGGSDCSCSPSTWTGNDTIIIHHSVNRNASNVSWGNAGRLVIEHGGALNINGNNRSIPMGGDETFVIKDGGELSVGNNFTIVLNSGNPYFEIEEGGKITAGNNLTITMNAGNFIGSGTLEANDLNLTSNNATTSIEIDGDWDITNALNLTLWGSSTDENLTVNGLITSGSIAGTNQTNITGTGAFIYDSGSINNPGALNGCTTCSTDSPMYLGAMSPSGEITDITLWDGNSWSNGTPTSALNVVFFGEFIANAGFTAKSLTVSNGAELVVASGEFIEVLEDIDNNGILKLENQAALVQTGVAMNTGDGTYIVEKAGFSASANQFNVWSAPIPDQQITEVFDRVNLYDIFVFDAQNQQWKYDYGTLTPTNNTGQSFQFSSSDLISGANGIMNSGTGYFIPGNAVKPARVFEGNSIHNGDITVPVYAPGIPSGNWTGSDWNLVGNPYPSGLSVSDFITNNSNIVNNLIYLWDNGNYIPKNSADTLVLSVGQGFWVQAKANGNVNFNNNMREGDATSTFRSGGSIPPAVYLSLQTADFSDPLRIYFTHQEGSFDAHQMGNANGINFYSFGQNREKFVFQDAMTPESQSGNVSIPVGVQYPRDTTLTVRFDRALALQDYQCYWVDTKLNTQIEIAQGDEVTFAYNIDDEERFELLVKVKTTSNKTAVASQSNEPEVTISSGQLRVINSTKKQIKNIQVFDVSGRLVNTFPATEAESTTHYPFNPTGVYIVSLVFDDKSHVNQKIIAR